jgi:predicted acylesterase/phospholipase RssA
MADIDKTTDGPTIAEQRAWDYTQLPDWDNDFVNEDDFLAFNSALSAPEQFTSPSEEDLLNPSNKQNAEFITALNDWRPVRQRRLRKAGEAKRRTKRKGGGARRGVDETREGWTYTVFKYPLLFLVLGWIVLLGICYILTRFYIYLYESLVTWRGTRHALRKKLRAQVNYEDWVKAAQELDSYLGNDKWKVEDEGSYYDWKMLRRILRDVRSLRKRAEQEEKQGNKSGPRAIDELRATLEVCVKTNFAGIENPRLYSETYYGTKDLLQTYTDEIADAVRYVFASEQLTVADKRTLAKHMSANFGRTALCLSGGATFAYYHFGIAKALLDADLLPTIITGTSGGALVAGLVATRTNEELKQLLVPALASRITACEEGMSIWLKRYWRTGARFDATEWAKKCAWFCHGSLTFAEAYERTGRILNVSCVPSDPHSPTILANYLTAPDCVVWSAVLASAAVPGILNPVVLMRKNRDGKLEPYNFGHKWKDGSLRTDIPLKSLNLHFNVNFSIVSQVNPHVSLWFFSSRGTVGRPVTHRRGRGWRGGFLGSAIEQFIKLDLNKWLKVARHLELLPRPMGQDWSQVFLQRFSGTITIWPKTRTMDFYYILSDPTMPRLANMIRSGQLAAWPKLKMLSNRLAIEKVIAEARNATRPPDQPVLPTPGPRPELRSMFSEEDLQSLLQKARKNNGLVEVPASMLSPTIAPREPNSQSYFPDNDSRDDLPSPKSQSQPRIDSPSLSQRVSGWWGSASRRMSTDTVVGPNHNNSNNNNSLSPSKKESLSPYSSSTPNNSFYHHHHRSSGSRLEEMARQSRVFFDDYDESEVEMPSDLDGGERTEGDETDYDSQSDFERDESAIIEEVDDDDDDEKREERR